jgi:hypothetical protein
MLHRYHAAALAALLFAAPALALAACGGPTSGLFVAPPDSGAGGSVACDGGCYPPSEVPPGCGCAASEQDAGCCCPRCMVEAGADALSDVDVDAHSDGAGPPLFWTACGATACPAGYSGVWVGTTPDTCGAAGCAAPAHLKVCALEWVEVWESCDLALACAAGRSLAAAYATCDCPGGLIYVCV